VLLVIVIGLYATFKLPFVCVLLMLFVRVIYQLNTLILTRKNIFICIML